jgi:biotin-dependent carboxylase-like uncharacterized protein
MTLIVEKPGLQTTIQGRPRTGQRHLGVPASGPADPLSMALANRLVGNAAFSSALETTLTGVTLRFESDAFIAVTGAVSLCSLNDIEIEQHATIAVRPDDVLVVGSAEKGVRSYVAFSGGLEAQEILGSTSTYLTAELGGLEGRALRENDVLVAGNCLPMDTLLETPAEYRLPMLGAWSVRAGMSCESSEMKEPEQLFERKFSVANRSDRMGVKLDGHKIEAASDARMPSVAVFPGIVQCPQDGSPYILSVDSGTTGGYPRVAKVTRMDLHILGQLRSGNGLRLIERDDERAAIELREKHAYWRHWLPDIAEVI